LFKNNYIVDAPECAHFGMPGQEYGPVAKEWLTNYVLNHDMYVVAMKRDQYSRIVAESWVYKPPSNAVLRFIAGYLLLGRWTWFWKDVSLEMLKAGYAVTYESAGGVFFYNKFYYKYYETMARWRRKGMWVKGRVESPRDYKIRMKKQ